MSLRRRIPEAKAQYPNPVLGINLRSSIEDLKPGEAAQMQNMKYHGGTRMRFGSQRLTPTALASGKQIRGLHKYYFGGASPQEKRLVAYDTKISVIADNGTETNLTSGMTADKDTHFVTWSITDKVYLGNGSDTLRSYDGTTFATVAGTAIPTSRWLAPIGDRLMAITTNGIERTNPRDPTIWSNNSSWATIRPSRVGLFTCIQPVSVRGIDTIYPGLLAFQPNAYYLITGTNFGPDVTAVTQPTGEDSKIQLMDNNVGCSSPYSVVSVPGLGTAWFTSDLNVYLLPEGQLRGMYIGDKLKSNGQVTGIESTNSAALSQVWMAYFDRFLMLGIPTGNATHPTMQFWMDMYSYTLFPQRGPVWYGPMLGQSIARVVVENQQSDFAMYGGEGDSTVGAFIYQMRVGGYFKDAVGLIDNDISCIYDTYYNAFGAPSMMKYIRSVHMDLNYTSGTPLLSLYDIDGTSLTSQTISAVSN